MSLIDTYCAGERVSVLLSGVSLTRKSLVTHRGKRAAAKGEGEAGQAGGGTRTTLEPFNCGHPMWCIIH